MSGGILLNCLGIYMRLHICKVLAYVHCVTVEQWIKENENLARYHVHSI